MAEIEDMFLRKDGRLNLVCLTETQKKQDSILISKNVVNINSMREKKDRKGGGLMILYRKNNKMNFNKIENKNKNILEIEGRCLGIKLRIVLVYFDVRKGTKGTNANKPIQRAVEKIIEKEEEEALIILGDFNGHIGIIKETRPLDKNGKMILRWLDDYNLTLLNLDEKCEGAFTRTIKDQKSIVDYVLINKKMYNRFKEMKIDENKEIYDRSDHNLITVNFMVKNEGNIRKNPMIEREYYTKDPETLKIYCEKLEQYGEENKIEDLTEMLETEEKIAKEILLKKYRRKEIQSENKTEESPWMNDQIRKEIQKRKEWNKATRNAKSERERSRLENEYKKQKEKVQKLIRRGMEEYEIKITKEIREKTNKQKKLWENINILRGKKRNTEEEEKYFKEDGTEMELEEAGDLHEKYLKEIWNKIDYDLTNVRNEDIKKRDGEKE